jgi:hypothetical protein
MSAESSPETRKIYSTGTLRYTKAGLFVLFVWLTWIGTIPLVLFQAAIIPLYISLFPAEKYGQFSSANAMLRSSMVVLGGLASGRFLDHMSNSGQVKDALRWMYIWGGFWYLVALACLVGVYVHWKRRGGDGGYTPPGSIAERKKLGGLAHTGQPGEVTAAH